MSKYIKDLIFLHKNTCFKPIKWKYEIWLLDTLKCSVQWWVEFDDALNWLFTKTLRDFYPICRKLIISAPNCHKDYLFYFLGNFCVIKSLQIIDPTLVAFNRALEIIFGYAFQIIVMEQMPTLLSITGAGLVLFSVLAISLQDILIRYIPEKMKFLF